MVPFTANPAGETCQLFLSTSVTLRIFFYFLAPIGNVRLWLASTVFATMSVPEAAHNPKDNFTPWKDDIRLPRKVGIYFILKAMRTEEDANGHLKLIVSTLHTPHNRRTLRRGFHKLGLQPIRNGEQRAEISFDNLAGCLRAASGGSSRQIVLVVRGKDIRSRLISSREAAQLMGLPDNYRLPDNYSDAYQLCGDGVAVPVGRFLAQEIFEPVLRRIDKEAAKWPEEQAA